MNHCQTTKTFLKKFRFSKITRLLYRSFKFVIIVISVFFESIKGILILYKLLLKKAINFNTNIIINKHNLQISNDEILEYVCKKYKLEINKEKREALYYKCKHKFIYLLGETFCYKCSLVTGCKSCIRKSKEEQYKNTEKLDKGEFNCSICKCIAEWIMCDKCKCPFDICLC